MAATGPAGSLACSTPRAASAPTSCCWPATPSTAIACRTSLIDRTAAVIAAAEIPVVLLPGNHDPVLPDAVFHRKSLAAVPNLHIIGLTHDEAIVFPALDLEIWGRAHRDYSDMIPFETVRPRRTRWQIATAHGHYVPTPDRVTLAAAVVADRRRRDRRDRRRLCGARALEFAGQGRQWRGRGLLLGLAGIRRHVQRGPAGRLRRRVGDAREA